MRCERLWLDFSETRKGTAGLFFADYIRDELGRRTGVSADAGGRPLRITRYLGAEPVVETRTYDRLGRLVWLSDPGGSVWT